MKKIKTVACPCFSNLEGGLHNTDQFIYQQVLLQTAD